MGDISFKGSSSHCCMPYVAAAGVVAGVVAAFITTIVAVGVVAAGVVAAGVVAAFVAAIVVLALLLLAVIAAVGVFAIAAVAPAHVAVHRRAGNACHRAAAAANSAIIGLVMRYFMPRDTACERRGKRPT